VNRGQDVLLNIDIQGAMKIKRTKFKAVYIFVLPPSMAMLKERLVGRSTDSKKEVAKRLRLAKKEMTYLSKYDYVVVNNVLESALENLRAIVIAERCKVGRN